MAEIYDRRPCAIANTKMVDNGQWTIKYEGYIICFLIVNM